MEKTSEALLVPEKPKPDKRRRKYLTAREYRFYKFLLENIKSPSPRPDREGMREAGYSEKSLDISATKERIAAVLSANDELREKLNAAGLGVDSLVEDFKELRESKTPKGTPDNSIRFKTLELRTKVLKADAPKKIQIDERRAIVHLTPEVLEQIRKIKTEEQMREILEE